MTIWSKAATKSVVNRSTLLTNTPLLTVVSTLREGEPEPMLALEGFNWGTGISDAWSKVASVAPKVVVFLVILVLGRIVVGFLRRAFRKVLDRAGFNRVVERAGLTKALSMSGRTPSATVAKLLGYALMLLVVTTAFAVFGANNPVSQMLNQIVAFLPKVFVAIAIVVVAGFVARVVRELVAGLLKGKVSNADLLAKIAGVAVLVIGGFAALNQLQIAPAIINGLFYAMLAIMVGSAIIAIGGGGIGPMRRQWEKAVNRIERPVDVDLTNAAEPRQTVDR